MKKERKKYLIIALILICIVFILSILLHLSDADINIEEENINTYNQNVIENTENFIEVSEKQENNNTSENNKISGQNDLTESTDEIDEEDEKSYNYDDIVLCPDTSLSIYFLTKFCLNNYYNCSNLSTQISLLDIDVGYLSNLLVSNWIYKDYYKVTFAIDEIYVQELYDDIFLILVYYRYTTDNETCNDSVMAIRVDNANCTYSIYPYEYLQANNYSELKSGDRISITNIESIEKNSYNQFDIEEIERTGQACTQELFEKIKFDILVDREHLYNTLDEEYREERFPTLQDLNEYIEENKESIYYESLTKYRVVIKSEYVQFTGITTNNRYVIFEVPEGLTDYTVYLDNYTINKLDSYEDSIETWQASYSLERVFSAISEKDYSFVYKHLNPVQKNNYYRTEEEFIEYIESIFYDSNNFEVDDEYLTVTDVVYQYTVYVTNNDNTSQRKTLTMTVTLEEGTDFVVAIN